MRPTALPTALPEAALHDGRERRADLAFDVADAHLRVIVEHQSSPRSDMALRCLDHLVIAARAASQSGTDDPLPRLHFLVLFQGPGRWTPPTHLASSSPPLPQHLAKGCLVPLYDVCHLEDLPLHTAPADARIAVRSLLRAAHNPRGTALWQLTDADLRDLHDMRGHLGSAAVFTVIGYLSTISSSPPPEGLMAQLQHQHPDLAEDFVSYHDQLLLEGQARGERIGEERATRLHEARLKRERERVVRERERAAQQQRELLLQLATQRFGPPNDAHRLLASQLDPERVHAALTQLLSAGGWNDLLR